MTPPPNMSVFYSFNLGGERERTNTLLALKMEKEAMKLRNAGNFQKLEKARKHSFLGTSAGTEPLWTSDL